MLCGLCSGRTCAVVVVSVLCGRTCARARTCAVWSYLCSYLCCVVFAVAFAYCISGYCVYSLIGHDVPLWLHITPDAPEDHAAAREGSEKAW
jgi:hypothetical protein